MKTLTLHSQKSNLYSNILRISVGVVGSIYLYSSISDYFTTYELTTGVVLYGILGVFILLLVAFNPTFGANIELTLNKEFMRTEEDLSLIRTAYWNKIDRLTLTRFSIRIKYQSGSSERFRLPYLSSNDHDNLQKWLQNISAQNDIGFSEKAWWKPF